MSLMINSPAVTPSLVTNNSTAISASGTAGFSVDFATDSTTTPTANTNTSNLSQLSADIQALLTQWQATAPSGTGQDTDRDDDGSTGAASGAASANGSTTDPATILQNDVKNVASDLFGLLTAASTELERLAPHRA